MKFPPKVKTNLKEGLDKLTKLERGEVVHFCVVRVAGQEDEDARVIFGGRATAATKEKFARIWADDDAVKESDRSKWFVVRGAFTVGDKGIHTLPAIRGNRVLASAELKSQLKGVRDSLTGCGVPTTPLKNVISGTFGRATDTSKLDTGMGVEDEEDEVEDEEDMKGVDGAKSAEVAELVARFKKVGLKAALAKLAAAVEAPAQALARTELTKVRDTLIALDEEGTKLGRGLRGKTLGSKRYKESLGTLDELATRARDALKTVETALGNKIGRAELAADSDNAPDDRILDVLRGLISKLNAAPEQGKLNALTDLYFATDTWLKLAGEGSSKRIQSEKVDLSMKPKVLPLYEKAAKQLAERAGVTLNNLPAWLERNHGKGLTEHGLKLDVDQGLAKWMTADQRDVFRLHPKGGKLYQYNWWTWPEDEIWNKDGRTDLSKKKLVLADSSNVESKPITAGYSGYVMSMSGDLYITLHVAAGGGAKEASVYHSSYMAGLPVLLAGEMLIKGGTVKRVNTNSGHYAPPIAMVSRFLKQMQTLGVKVESVADHTNVPQSVEEFLAAHADGGPNAQNNERDEIANAKHLQALQMRRLLAEDHEAVTAAANAISALGRAVNDVKAFLRRKTEGRDHPRGKDSEPRLRREVKLGRKHCEDLLPELAKAAARLETRLREREKNHADLKSKNTEEGPDMRDGYVSAVTSTLEEVRTATANVRTAVAESAEFAAE